MSHLPVQQNIPINCSSETTGCVVIKCINNRLDICNNKLLSAQRFVLCWWLTPAKSKCTRKPELHMCGSALNTTLPLWGLSSELEHCWGFCDTAAPLQGPRAALPSSHSKMEAAAPQAAQKCCWSDLFFWENGTAKSSHCCIITNTSSKSLRNKQFHFY